MWLIILILMVLIIIVGVVCYFFGGPEYATAFYSFAVAIGVMYLAAHSRFVVDPQYKRSEPAKPLQSENKDTYKDKDQTE